MSMYLHSIMHIMYEYVFTQYSVRAKKIPNFGFVHEAWSTPRRSKPKSVTFIYFYISYVPETRLTQNRMS
jgi:hypothetical protein